ncbi:metal ABC transporter substrate-binding protein [bacterium]|nr:metal ABC transporter substrate-binding protein [bacterium]
MQKYLFLLLFIVPALFAKVEVAVSYPYIAALTKAVGGENVEVATLAKGNWDPHFVVPRPSLIRKVAEADLLIINGAQLEIGWMPPLIAKSNNSRIQPGTNGFLDLSHVVTLIDKPSSVSRSGGDIHPDGNPHFSTDPFIMPSLADAIAAQLAHIDPEHAAAYQTNAEAFTQKWKQKLAVWEKEMEPLKGKKVVQYHELYNYFLKRFGMVSIGNIEPLPGINPSSRHTMELIDQMKAQDVTLILQDVYHNPKTAAFIAEKTGAHVVTLPHDVDAVHEADTLENLYNTMISRVTQP